ncbi:homocysteine S-methyltransferase family protein, partial [bacterium]|nr:homocysteine S-methyltransferase family protein [bacterium]
MSNSFRELLAQRDRIIIFDGAMGTYLYVKGVNIHVNYDQLNITAPDLIKSIHEEYIKAGAEVISTNTFGANRFKLGNDSIGEQLEQIIRSGVRIARAAAEKTGTFVEGEIGPIGKLIEPLGPISRNEARTIFTEQVKILTDEGVDLIALETFSDLRELELAIECIQSICDVPIVAQLSLTEDCTTVL